jgi:5-methyltetrahydrofolate--homocysteine methyltransferase
MGTIAPLPLFDLHSRRRRLPLLRAMTERVLVCDGAMGTMIQGYELTAEDFGGKEGCNELLVATRPDVIRQIHAAYFEAGADCVETDTFGGARVVLAEYELGDRAYELNRLAAALAREVADRYSTPERPRFVLGSVGPTTRLVSLGHISFDELLLGFEEQIAGLIDGGVDGVLIETAQDILQVKCAALAAARVCARLGREVPVLVQITLETTGAMLVGTDIAAAVATLESLPVDVIGLNCATGPDLMVEHGAPPRPDDHPPDQRPAQRRPPAERRRPRPLPPDLRELATYQRRFASEFGVSVVGGCCGTTPEHIGGDRRRRARPHPRAAPDHYQPQLASLYSRLSARPGQRPAARRRAHQRQRLRQVPRAPARRRLGRHR